MNVNYNFKYSANSAMKNFLITTSDRLKKTKEYQDVIRVITKLMEGGVTQAGRGYCISMSDVVYTLLKQNNIPCKIVECNLSVTNKTSDQIFVVGFRGLKDDPNGADTHVVVVTETEIPMLIDISIAHLLPNNMQGIVDELSNNDENRIFANVETPDVILTFQHKTQYSIPMLHQRSIVDRIQTDVDIFKRLKTLKIMITFALCVSMLNAGRGFYDFYSVYVIENHWGPNAIRRIDEKIDRLSEDVHKLKK